MFNIGGWEFLVILVVALLFLGPERLPGAAKQAGKTLGTLREMAQSFQTELEQAVNDPLEAGARLAGDKAVEESENSKKAGQAAATAAHVAATEPDRTEKPLSGMMPDGAVSGDHTGEQGPNSDEAVGEAVPDPANLEFGSAAPRYPQADTLGDETLDEPAEEDPLSADLAGDELPSDQSAPSSSVNGSAATSDPVDVAAEGAGD